MVSVGKPIESFAPFIANARAKLVQVGLISVGALLAALALALIWLLRPLGLIGDLWRAARHGGGGSLPARLRLMAHALRAAVAEARDALAGRSYAEQYVQTLAHEIKSRWPPSAARRNCCASRCRSRAGALRRQHCRAGRPRAGPDRADARADQPRAARLARAGRAGVAGAGGAPGVAEATPIAERKHMRFEVDVPEPLLAGGDAFLLARAISNLVRNAIDFAPLHSTVEIAARESGRQVALTVRDHGPGLPPFAQRRVFEKFFSTARRTAARRAPGWAGLRQGGRRAARRHGAAGQPSRRRRGGHAAAAARHGRLAQPAFPPAAGGSSSLHIAFGRASHAVQGACAQFAACAAVVAARTGTKAMSISAVLLDGARRAATYVTMLFSLNSPQPAVAQPALARQAATQIAAAPAADGSVASYGLTLVAHHLDVRIAGDRASVQTLMLLRNDRPTEVSVQYMLPQRRAR